MHILKAESRTQTGKGNNRRLRSAGKMPGVLYGGTGDSSSVTVDAAELARLLRSES